MAGKNIKGTMVGHLQVLSRTTSKVHSYRCVCTAPGCGKRLTVSRGRLVHNKPKTHCGCLNGATRKPQGLSSKCKREYNVWRMMRVRCTDPRHVGYANYGGRGIKVCAAWNDPVKGFKAFLRDVGRRPKGLTLDRIDPDGNYEPNNVRWATWKQQASNKRAK